MLVQIMKKTYFFFSSSITDANVPAFEVSDGGDTIEPAATAAALPLLHCYCCAVTAIFLLLCCPTLLISRKNYII